MPAMCRLGDHAKAPADTHNGVCCPHIDAEGPATTAAETVFVNDREAVRETDRGEHESCCGQGTWTVTRGSRTVFIEDERAARVGDLTQHCGGAGSMIEGSPDVFVGN